MNSLSHVLHTIDEALWGPGMLLLLVGTGIVLTVRTRFLPWRKLPRAVRNTLQRDARTPDASSGGISPFAALMTALAATIGTGNIIGVSTAMVLGGPGALVWMWIAAAFGISSKFSECMLAVKYREYNAKGEIVGGPMYTLKKAFPSRRIGAVLASLFALFTVISSFGIGNMTQANSIADALHGTFALPSHPVGIVLTVLTLFVIVGGIRSISKIASVLVPSMAVLYVAAGLIVLLTHYQSIPGSLVRIITMAFSAEAVTGGFLGTVTASMLRAMRYGVARGVFSNEAGMGSAAITAAAASGHPVRQGYINMTGTFWDTIVVCTITGLCIMSSGVLGSTQTAARGAYANDSRQLVFLSAIPAADDHASINNRTSMNNSPSTDSNAADSTIVYDISSCSDSTLILTLNKDATAPGADAVFCIDDTITLTRPASGSSNLPPYPASGSSDLPSHSAPGSSDLPPYPASGSSDLPPYSASDSSDLPPHSAPNDAAAGNLPCALTGSWRDPYGCVFTFHADGTYTYAKPLTGAALTIAAFRSALGDTGAYFLTISIVLFAFSTILGWEYLGERAWEYLLKTHRYNMPYRILFSLTVYVGAAAALEPVWDFSNIANALMAIPNLLCLLALSGEVAEDLRQYEKKSLR